MSIRVASLALSFSLLLLPGVSSTAQESADRDGIDRERGTVVDIAVGEVHSLAVMSDGSVWTWGLSGNGQLGREVTEGDYYLPVRVSGVSGNLVAAGGSFSFVYDGETLWGTGYNVNGYLGWGPSSDEFNFTALSLPGLADIDAHGAHVVALMADGTVRAWGEGTLGEAGNGTNPRHQVEPVQVSDLRDVVEVSAGGSFSLARRSDGSVWAWGSNYYATLGTPDVASQPRSPDGVSSASPVQAQTYSTVPVQAQVEDVIAIGGGDTHALAVRSDSTVWGWGLNLKGALGRPDYDELFIEPIQIEGITDAVAVAAGTGYSLALRADGTVMIWGHINGTPFPDGWHVARQLPLLRNITKIDAAQLHVLVITENGNVASLGDNGQGQLGTRQAVTAQYEPVRVSFAR